MTRRPRSRAVVLPVVFLLAAATLSPAHGQTETGTIYGSVTDPTGAVVANAAVRLIDTDRGLKSEVATWKQRLLQLPQRPLRPLPNGGRKERIQTSPPDRNHCHRAGQSGAEFQARSLASASAPKSNIARRLKQ